MGLSLAVSVDEPSNLSTPRECKPRLGAPLDAPKVLEARRRPLSVANRVLDVAVSEVSLQRPRVVPSVRQRACGKITEPPTTLLIDRLCQCLRLAASETGVAVVVRDDQMSANC